MPFNLDVRFSLNHQFLEVTKVSVENNSSENGEIRRKTLQVHAIPTVMLWESCNTEVTLASTSKMRNS